jgi:hypothetical protein
MNYSKISAIGSSESSQFDVSLDDKDFDFSDIKNVLFEFQLGVPNFLEEDSLFSVYTDITIRSLHLRRDVLLLKTKTLFRIKDFNLSHNTDVLAGCCQIAFEQSLVIFTDGVKGRTIENILFTYDNHKLDTDLEVYLWSHYHELKNYIRKHFI